MNAGAHNGCVANMLVSTQVLSLDGTLASFTPEELGYTYRSSLLQGGKQIVTQATFQLQPGADPLVVTARTKEHKEHRLSTQPYSYPSCGSVFRNPITICKYTRLNKRFFNPEKFYKNLYPYTARGLEVFHKNAEFSTGLKCSDVLW